MPTGEDSGRRDKLLRRAVELHRAGRLLEAERLYTEILASAPNDFDALHMLGVLAGQTQQPERAVSLLRRAIAANDRVAAAHANLALALAAAQRLDECAAAYDQIIALTPADIDAYTSKAAVLYELARPQEALATLEQAIARDPGNPRPYWNAALCSLLLGRYERAWHLYEWRHSFLRSKGTDGILRTSRIRPERLWNGRDSLLGKTLFVQCEQGFGDILQFSRYLPLLRSRGAQPIFSVPPALHRLLQSLGTIELTSERDRRTHATDYDCWLLSMPLAFATTVATVPAAVPYLEAEPERVAHWRRRIGAAGFSIGVSWQGKPGPADAGRSFPLSLLEPLAAVPGVRLISLQKGPGSEQLRSLPHGMSVQDLGDELDAGPDAFVDTAAVMRCLDLVITLDSAIAHLAGALGLRTWLALKFAPDWRWLLDRADSPWYPTLRLFRQRRSGDWVGVFQAMAQELPQLL